MVIVLATITHYGGRGREGGEGKRREVNTKRKKVLLDLTKEETVPCKAFSAH